MIMTDLIPTKKKSTISQQEGKEQIGLTKLAP